VDSSAEPHRDLRLSALVAGTIGVALDPLECAGRDAALPSCARIWVRERGTLGCTGLAVQPRKLMGAPRTKWRSAGFRTGPAELAAGRAVVPAGCSTKRDETP
jgi:hypothetical protein